MSSDEKIVAVVFPGQGAQRPGMGKDFVENLSVCRETFEEASDALGWDVAKVCFSDDERLSLTEYTQPCLLTTEIAMFRGLVYLYGLKSQFFGGHSLGEITSLVAAGVLTLADGVRIVEQRGRLMQQAAPKGTGGMMAVIGERVYVNEIASTIEDLPVDVANVNSPKQIVISGLAEALPVAAERIAAVSREQGVLRFVPLNVSAPFHSRFMRPVESVFQEILRSIARSMNTVPARNVTSNFRGDFHRDEDEAIIYALTRQIGSPVRWVENMEVLASKADVIYEIGPSRPLREFFKALGVDCISITTLSSAARVFEREH
ncbi:MAG: ACP S-malonyltransferase [Syntrophales bacterium]|nr:ACP S-malonyltransferase [Syntrophales bacterium]